MDGYVPCVAGSIPALNKYLYDPRVLIKGIFLLERWLSYNNERYIFS